MTDPQEMDLLQDVFAEEGIRVLTGVDATEVAHADGQFTVELGAAST